MLYSRTCIEWSAWGNDQVCKSVLSPYVPEFVPSAQTKKFNQSEIGCSQNSAICEKPLRNLQETDIEKQADDVKTHGISKQVSTLGVKNEKQAILSWRQRDFGENEFSDTQKYNLNNPDRNWRYRRHEESLDNSQSQSRNENTLQNSTRNQLHIDKTKRTISFQSSLRSNSGRRDGSHNQSIGEFKGFGRGRGKPRNAWTNDYGSKEKDFKVLRQSNCEQGSNPGLGLGRVAVSYSDTLKGISSKKKNDFQGDTQQLCGAKNEQRQGIKKVHQQTDGCLATDDNSASKATRVDHEKKQKTFETIDDQNETELQDKGGKWARGSRKKLSSDIMNNDHEIKCKQENKWTKAGKANSQTEQKGFSQKHETDANKNNSKERVDEGPKMIENKDVHVHRKTPLKNNTSKDVQQVSETEQESDHPTKDCNAQSEQKGILQKNKHGKYISPADFNTKTKKMKLLSRKDEEVSAKSEAFNILHNENEFPDLESTGSKSTEISSLASDWLSGGNRMPIISYSAALKAIPKPQARKQNKPSTTESEKSMLADGGEGGDTQSKKKKKKKKKKKNKDQDKPEQPPQQSAKKTKQPMQLDLGDWISVLDKSQSKNKADKQSSKKVTIATGVLQIKLQSASDARSSEPPNAKSTTAINKGFHNVLDSTAPLVKRGKEREIPKKKKPSPLKKIILKEREEKKKRLDGTTEDDDKTNENTEDKSMVEEPPFQTDQEDQEDFATSVHSDVVIKETILTAVPTDEDIKAQIHSRRFREYCDNVMDKELNKTTTELLQKLVVFQDRQYHKDPIKSKAKRRFVVGLREVTKHLKLKKVKLVIISPNVERIKSAGGLDDTLHNIITIAHQNGVPVVFALRRQILGRILHKKVPVSAVGVFNYDGAQDHFKELMDLTEKARAVYAERWKKAYEEMMERIQKEKDLQPEQLEEQQEQTMNPQDIQESSSDENYYNETEETTTDMKNSHSLLIQEKKTEIYSDDEAHVPPPCQKENENSVEGDIDIEDL